MLHTLLGGLVPEFLTRNVDIAAAGLARTFLWKGAALGGSEVGYGKRRKALTEKRTACG